MLGDRLVLVFEDGQLAQLDLKSSPGLSNSLFDPVDIEGTVKAELREILTKYNLERDGK